MDGDATATMVLRLAAPLQAWGRYSQGNRRDVGNAPTKSGVIGLLAAARGTRRTDSIEDLLQIRLGVRTDRPGTLLRDYHTVSDFRGRPLLSVSVDSKGRQKTTSPKKFTGVTERFYVQDAVYVAAVQAERGLIESLIDAVQHPAFPLALGRRSCVPTQPLLLAPEGSYDRVWHGSVLDVLTMVPWQGNGPSGRVSEVNEGGGRSLPCVLDAGEGLDGHIEEDRDVPSGFDHLKRSFRTRRVAHTWVEIAGPGSGGAHGFELLGGD